MPILIREDGNDFIIETGTRPVIDLNSADGVKWVDDKKDQAYLKKHVEVIIVYMPIYNEEGVANYQKLILTRKQITALFDKVKEIEDSPEFVGSYDDLPF